MGVTKIVKQKLTIPEDKIILLDLNYTLVANSPQCKKPYPERILEQKYETKLLELIKNNYTILITARPEKYKKLTLKHIKQETGFTPDESYWNKQMTPPKIKEHWLNKKIFPTHGNNPKKYLAIESNPKTRIMYQKYQIEAYPKNRYL